GRQQVQLAKLFFERHAGEEGIEVLGRSWCGEEDRENQNVADTRHRIALSGPGKVQQSYGPKRDVRSPSAGRDRLQVMGTHSISREMIHVSSSFSLARLHHAARLPSVAPRTNHHRHRSRLYQGSAG